ncbi:MAG: glycosyltransferase family 4 protein, partial [Endomicrobium sp.]|nr:glycosyltransferase family 4 protein [Endomicrobium sp.]
KNVILTRNAICGGVESIIKVEAELLDADVIVCGGLDYKELAPFEYVRADNREDLLKQLVNYSLIIYHWIPDYAVKAVAETKIPSIEFVHRTDTNDCDKSVPSAVVTHSKFLGEYIFSTSGVRCDIIDHPIDTDIFVPAESLGKYIGGITSYYDVKGIDVFIRAWAKIKDEFPSIKARFYGKGLDLEKFQKLSKKLNADIEFLSATTMPEIKLRDFCLVVCPSRCEGLPVVILEALAMNIPVIASNLDGMMEFKKTAQFQGYDDIITLTKQEDPLILAGAMKRQLKGNYRQNTRDFIKKFYSKENHIMGLKKVIDKIIMAKRDI